ncbi:Aste57867_16694 [Aphanomyces stellatus]|uniref:Aste57867_16694 protein n=1 Tax=Aphanomyces stellatus TaxID=120398 RepID=A0A485L6V8_9STRA|nr:hypothetical protein As57867_016637 [Aphanomyces stellatus]VFT93464.1 Aste57867_16694 [Aphanomyces stellatus]
MTTTQCDGFTLAVQYCFGRQSRWEDRRFRISRESLDVYTSTGDVHLHSLALPSFVLEHEAGHVYQVKKTKDGRLQFLIACPNPTTFGAFTSAIRLAKTSQPGPPLDMWGFLEPVAHSILMFNQTSPLPSVAVSTISVAKVQRRWEALMKTYEGLLTCASVEDVYGLLLDEEDAFVANPRTLNLAQLLIQYAVLRNENGWKRVNETPKKSLKAIFSHCPHPSCRHPLPLEQIYAIHVETTTSNCSNCHSALNYRVFQLAQLIRHNDTIVFPPVPRDGLVETFMSDLSSRCQATGNTDTVVVKINHLVALHLNACLGAFDFDLVHRMLHGLRSLSDWRLISTICNNYEFWSRPQVIQASIVRYHKFMHLIKFLRPTMVPLATFDISLVYTAHLSYADEFKPYYAKMTNGIVSAPLDPDLENPLTLDDNTQAFAGMGELWAEHFKDDYLAHIPNIELTTHPRTNHFDSVPSHKQPLFGLQNIFCKGSSGQDKMIPVIGTPYLDYADNGFSVAPIVLLLKARWKTAPYKEYATGWTEHPITQLSVNDSL